MQWKDANIIALLLLGYDAGLCCQNGAKFVYSDIITGFKQFFCSGKPIVVYTAEVKTMNFNQFTIKSQEAVQQAQQLAAENSQQAVETGHLLKGLLMTDENVVTYLLKKVNANVTRIEQATDAIIKSYPKVSGEAGQYLSGDTNSVLIKAQSLLKEFGDEFVSVEHILLALLSGKEKVGDLLRDAGVTEKELKKAILELRGGSKVTSHSAENQYNLAGEIRQKSE